MSKDKETKIEAPKAKNNFPDYAVGIRQNPTTKMWEVITLKYNVEFKASFIEQVEEVGDNRLSAIEKFKIKVVHLGLV